MSDPAAYAAELTKREPAGIVDDPSLRIVS